MGKGSEGRKRQKERRVFEHQVQPSLEASETAYQTFVKLEQVIDPHRLARKEQVLRLQGRLLDPSTKKQVSGLLKQLKTDTFSTRPPTGYYVIVGRGAAAVVNHTTLRQSTAGRDRIGNVPVMHVGFADPWLHYHEHGMGQPPYLLGLPGYHEPVRPDARTVRSGCSSVVFAESTLSELAWLRATFATYVVEGWVAFIESQTSRWDGTAVADSLEALGLDRSKVEAILRKDFKTGYPPYRLLVVSPEKDLYFVYATKIDLCSGAGRMRVALTDPHRLAAAAKTPPWLPPYRWTKEMKARKVVHGMDGLTEQTTWGKDSRVCIYGSGGIGLNQIERAEDEASVFADWLPRNTLHDTFNLRRNDTVLRHPDEDRAMNPGENDACRQGPATMDTAVHLFPARDRWRFGTKGEVEEVGNKDDRVEVKVKAQVGAKVGYSTREYSDLDGTSFPYKEGYAHKDASAIAAPALYDRVILCNGQVQNEAGEPLKVAGQLAFAPQIKDGRMVAMQAANGDVRILGGAAVMYQGAMATLAGQATETYRQGLPASAVLPGFILAGSSIAYANGYFEDHPNTNVNTIPQSDLTRLLETGGLGSVPATTLAADVVTCRKWPENGIPDRDTLKKRLTKRRHDRGESLSEADETALKKLTFAY